MSEPAESLDATDPFRESVPHVVVVDAEIVEVSASVAVEIGCDPTPLLGPLADIGTRLDGASYGDLCDGIAQVRVRLSGEMDDRPVRLRSLDRADSTCWIEIRSLGDVFRLESLLRRSGLGHALLSPSGELEWSMTSDALAEVLPGDDPMSWVALMDPDDMRALRTAIREVGADPTARRSVTHRLEADRTRVVVDEIESAVHDPDLRAVVVRSRLGDPTDPPTARSGASGRLTVSDHMPIGVVVASDTGIVLHRNAVAAELVGTGVGQRVVPDVAGGPWLLSRLDSADTERYLSVFETATRGRRAHCTIASPVADHRWLRVSISPAVSSTVVITIEDTTELAEAERALRASNRLLEALDSRSEDLVVVFDSLGRSRYTSSSARAGADDGSRVDHVADLTSMAHPDDRDEVTEVIADVRARPSSTAEVAFRVVRGGDDAGRWHAATITNHLADPDVRGVVLIARDVHEQRLAELDLVFRATHDPLTTLPDRAALQRRLDDVLVEAERHGSRTALMFLDVDDFKTINDSAGHGVGDAVLREVAERLRSCLRDSDVVGRFGGDEFVLVAPGVSDDTHALDLAERVLATVTGSVRADGIEIAFGISLGVAVTGEGCTTAAQLLHRADAAMYRSKLAGRGRVTLHRPEHDVTHVDISLRSDLGRAIDAGALDVHYQPIVPLRDGLVGGFESLARWEHAEYGQIDTERFLAVAEVAGLSPELGDEMVRLVCVDDRSWMLDGEFVSINLSVSQVGRDDTAGRLLERLRASGIDPSEVVVELTEASFGQGRVVRDGLERFRAAGVRIFLDDFGTGYSSLRQLHRFPVDGIKIDASVVAPSVDESLVRLIVGVATTLDIRTIAEGVETERQLETVRRLGVDYAQGYLLGRPRRAPRRADPQQRGP
ncbi:putative bifunctional diguanylate cyclase/phosphodiesterase [Ilumatobacter sp.]|uniref:putative bifunctional diguanylate cyclase/phosphodiesterase n=1 Tax=Ilumatobacter sp. TaxID=1967498 RepID=UPI003B51B601